MILASSFYINIIFELEDSTANINRYFATWSFPLISHDMSWESQTIVTSNWRALIGTQTPPLASRRRSVTLFMNFEVVDSDGNDLSTQFIVWRRPATPPAVARRRQLAPVSTRPSPCVYTKVKGRSNVGTYTKSKCVVGRANRAWQSLHLT